MTRGEWTQLASSWPHLTAAAAVGDRVFAACDGAIWRIDDAGGYEQLGDDEWRSRFLVGVANHLVAIEPGGGMFRIDPVTGSWVQLDGDWSTVIAATAGGDAIFVVERSGSLYRVEPADGSYHLLGDGFESTAALAAAAGMLVSIEGAAMYRISPKDATSELVDTAWADTRTLAGDDRAVYAACGEALYAVDPRDGSYENLGDGVWTTQRMVVMGGALYTFEGGGDLYRVEL